MSVDETILELDEFCIETTARKRYRELADHVLEGVGDGAGEGELKQLRAERAIDLLTEFLAKEDFRAIRARDPKLSGGHTARVRIYRDESGAVRWEKLHPRSVEG